MVTASLHGSSGALPGCGRLDRDDVFLGEEVPPMTFGGALTGHGFDVGLVCPDF